jgi:hypothetical protein
VIAPATPRWLGERLDVGDAVDVLHPRAIATKGDWEFDRTA